MAYTVTRDKTVFGNKAVVGLTVIADGATEAIATGLKNIDYFSYGPASMNSSNIHISKNEGVTSTSIAGTLGITGCTAGDEFCIVVYGTR